MAETIVRPAAPQAFERFGTSVASSGNTLVVGADYNGGLGRAYVFVWDGASWAEQATLFASDGQRAFEYFGTSVAVDGDCVVVGARSAGQSGGGQAYVFRRAGTSWNEEARLAPSVPGGYGFGQSVAVHGDDAIVGGAQVAYFFRRSGGVWSESARVTSPVPTPGSSFGTSVSIHGDYAIVGDYWEGGAAPHQGSAVVFERAAGGWAPVTPVLAAPDAVLDDRFGRAVAIHGDRLIVGAPGATGGGVADAGAAYVYLRYGTSWGLEQKLEPQSADFPHLVHDFGDAVSLARDFALVGNPTDHRPQPGSGAVHLFSRLGSRWTRVAPVLRASMPGAFDYYGQALSVSDAGAFVGAPNVRGAGYDEGLVYGYGLPVNLADRLRADRDWSRYADVLFGVIGGGPGVIVKPGSGPVPIDPEPFVTWGDLDASLRQRVVAEALLRLSDAVDDRQIRARVAEAARAVAKRAERRAGGAASRDALRDEDPVHVHGRDNG